MFFKYLSYGVSQQNMLLDGVFILSVLNKMKKWGPGYVIHNPD